MRTLQLTMRCAMVCVVLSAAAAAEAHIWGGWSKEIASDTLDRWVLSLWSDSGETITAFDIGIFDPLFEGNFVTGSEPIFAPTKDLDTSFLFQVSHKSGFQVVTDLVTLNPYEDGGCLVGMFARTSSGIYNGGWTPTILNPLELAEIVVPKDSITDPLNELLVLNSLPTWEDWRPKAVIGEKTIQFNCFLGADEKLAFLFQGPPPPPEPEPSTFVLLLTGLLGAAVYAWRRRGRK